MGTKVTFIPAGYGFNVGQDFARATEDTLLQGEIQTVNRYAAMGIYDAAVYVIPSQGKLQGELVVCNSPQALEVLHFGMYGSRVSAVPTPHLWRFLWDACRRMPVCPTA